MTDSSAGAKAKRFQTALFGNEAVAIALKVFRTLRLDVAQDRVARGIYGGKVPVVLVFDGKGQRVAEIYFRDFRVQTSKLLRAMARAAKGHGRMPLMTFVKKYRAFLNELDRLEAQKGTCTQKKARALKQGSKGKLAKLAKEERRLKQEEAKLLAKEKKLLESVKAYTLERSQRGRAVASALGAIAGAVAGSR